jgi:hypothetical protein
MQGTKIMITILVTSLVLAIPLISTSAISMPQIYSQTEQNMTKNMTNYSSGRSVQNLPTERELTLNDVKRSNLVLLQGVNNAIQGLEKSQSPKGEASVNTTHIIQLLKTGELGTAIGELDKLKAETIKSFGQEAANKQVVPQIDNLIGVLKKQQPPSQ